MFIEIGRHRWPHYEWGTLVQSLTISAHLFPTRGRFLFHWKPHITTTHFDWHFPTHYKRTYYIEVTFLWFRVCYHTYDEDRH